MRGRAVIAFLLLTACRSSDSGATQPERAPTDASPSAASPSAEAKSAEPKPTRPQKGDPEHAEKLRDLDDLCASVDHDYKDGTLGDYYSGLKMRTTWGERMRDSGLESTQPGRLLEAAVNEVDRDHDDPLLPHCHTLLDYLDDVE